MTALMGLTWGDLPIDQLAVETYRRCIDRQHAATADTRAPHER